MEVTLVHPAVAEDDPLERRVTEADQIDPAFVEGDVAEAGLGELGARQPAAVELHTVGRATNRAFARPVPVGCDHVGQVAEPGGPRRRDPEVGGIRGEGRLRHPGTISVMHGKPLRRGRP